MFQILIVSLAAFVGSVINAVAGGGTFIVFPALTGVGQLTEKLANITSTLGIWPGSAASVVAARKDFHSLHRGMLLSYCLISLLGGAVGSLLVIGTSPAQFKLIIPWLLAFATVLFAMSQPIARWTGRHQSTSPSAKWTIFIGFVQFAVAIYGGYFGAGMGVLMLAGLAFTGLQDIHQMNAMKVLLGTIINGVACVIFLFGHPAWGFVFPMAVCAAAGGFFGMAVARKVPRSTLRFLILLCGATLTIVYFVKNYGPMMHHPDQPTTAEVKMPSNPVIENLESRVQMSHTHLYVATTGDDSGDGTFAHPFKTIQHALNAANKPGDTVYVEAGTYTERLTLPHSGSALGGSASGGYITLQNYNGQHVLLSGQNANTNDIGFGQNMIQIVDKSYLKISGFEIAYNSGKSVKDDAFGIRVQGSGSHIQILNNTVHDMTGKVTKKSGDLNIGYAGAGIHVYGSSTTTPYSDVTISGNTIYNCDPGDDSTETLTLNGNVTEFSIDHNTVHDNNNLGIDMIGGEADVFNKPEGTTNLPVARNGVCEDNTVYNIHANYGGGYAGGIYVDGGKDIIVQRNRISTSDMGIEIGSENHGYISSGVVVRDNLIAQNTQAGLAFGGYDKTVGRVENCTFTNNTLYHNDTTNQGNGEVWIQFATNNTVADNIIYSTSQDLLINSLYSTDNVSKSNLFYCTDGVAKAQFVWSGKSYSSLSTYQKSTGQDQASIFGDPKFANAAKSDFHLASNSPAINAGDSAFAAASGETDLFGDPRLVGKRVDLGAVEASNP